MVFTKHCHGNISLLLLFLAQLVSSLAGQWKAQVDLELAALLGKDVDSMLQNDGGTKFQKLFGDKVKNLTSYTVDIPIDHKNPEAKYKNHYWVNAEHYKPGGPVFIYDIGEGPGQAVAQYVLGNETSYISSLLKQWNGFGIAWEHRYYGDSLPFPVDLDTPAKDFRFLNNEQALADIPYFAKSFKWNFFPNSSLSTPDLTPASTPWVMVGGSYPGMRAAFTRKFYPETIQASLASSAPVEARIDMSAYYEQVYRGLYAYGYGNCTKDVRAAYVFIDAELHKGGEAAAKIKKMFLGPETAKINNGDFTAALTNVWQTWQSFGVEGGIGDFCDWLETNPKTGKIAPAEGWAPTLGNEAMATRFAAWPKLIPLVNDNLYTNCNGTDPTQPISCDVGQRTPDPSLIAWTWQYCSQWGFFQFQSNTSRIVSSFQTAEYIQKYCYFQFPDGLSSGYLPKQPKTHEINAVTGGWYIRPSNVYFTDGQYDPWRTLSTLSNETFSPRFQITQEIPECGQPTPKSTVFGMVIPDAQHCYDMRLSFEGADKSRALFDQALKKWLPCFQKKKA